MCMYVTSWPFVTLPDCWALHLASTWPYLRCDVGLEEGKHWEKKSCLCLSIVYHYNGAQWYKQFLQVGRLDTVDNAWFNSSVSSVFMVFTIFCIVSLYGVYNCSILYFTYWWAELDGIGPWPGWTTIVLQCCDTAGWVVWLTKSSPKWPTMCRVGR